MIQSVEVSINGPTALYAVKNLDIDVIEPVDKPDYMQQNIKLLNEFNHPDLLKKAKKIINEFPTPKDFTEIMGD